MNEPYNLNRPAHHITNDVLRRIEAICHENGLEVAFGVRVHNAINQLVEQYQDAIYGTQAQLQDASDALQPFAQFAHIKARQHEHVTISVPIEALQNARAALGGAFRDYNGDFIVDEPLPITKIGYQPVPDFACPYCETETICTDDGLDDEGFPLGDIYCVTCNRVFQQAVDVRPVADQDIEESGR